MSRAGDIDEPIRAVERTPPYLNRSLIISALLLLSEFIESSSAFNRALLIVHDRWMRQSRGGDARSRTGLPQLARSGDKGTSRVIRAKRMKAASAWPAAAGVHKFGGGRLNGPAGNLPRQGLHG